MVLHQPVKKHVFNVRATYQREAEKVIAHLASLSIARVALVCPDDSFGTNGLASAKKGLTAAQLTPVATEKCDRVPGVPGSPRKTPFGTTLVARPHHFRTSKQKHASRPQPAGVFTKKGLLPNDKSP